MLLNVFVTVGTTKFDKLLDTVTDRNFINVLINKGCKRLKLQIGNGIQPNIDNVCDGIEIEIYRFKDSIWEDINDADLVISHGGAGCCLETLDAEKPLVAVINEDLMNNHQIDVASKLHQDGHLISTTCMNLLNVIQKSDFSKLKVFPRSDPTLFAKSLDSVMGFS